MLLLLMLTLGYVIGKKSVSPENLAAAKTTVR